jgi:hypothetical protein
LFYLAIGGIVVVLAMVAYFAHGLWQNREVWADVYVLHDASRPQADRVQTALRLARASRLSDEQLIDISLRRDLPDLARYILAEAVSMEALAHDPRAYSLAVARSRDWPDWLRLLLARRLAYGAGRSYGIPREALEELTRHSDPMIGLWASYALALQGKAGVAQRAVLEHAARGPAPDSELAAMLLAALDAREPGRSNMLDRATLWLRRHHPQAIKIWEGWPDLGEKPDAPVVPAEPSSGRPSQSGSG